MAEPNQGNNAAPRRARTGGSGWTVFYWDTGTGEANNMQPLAFARQVAHVSPPPVGPGATPIQPLDARRPLEIITPAATSMGTLTLELYELYNGPVWDQLSRIAGSVDLADIFLAVANSPNNIKMYKKIKPPDGARQGNRTEIYHGCVIANVADGETIEVGTMEVLKPITINYTHVTRK